MFISKRVLAIVAIVGITVALLGTGVFIVKMPERLTINYEGGPTASRGTGGVIEVVGTLETVPANVEAVWSKFNKGWEKKFNRQELIQELKEKNGKFSFRFSSPTPEEGDADLEKYGESDELPVEVKITDGNGKSLHHVKFSERGSPAVDQLKFWGGWQVSLAVAVSAGMSVGLSGLGLFFIALISELGKRAAGDIHHKLAAKQNEE